MIEEILRKLTAEIEKLKKHTEQLSTVEKPWSFVPLTTPLTSTDFDGDSFSTTAKTKIDLSDKFGTPAGIKAVLLHYGIKDSASETGGYYISFSPNDTVGEWAALFKIQGLTNDVQYRDSSTIPCDANGDIYYQINASGVETMDVVIQIWGYFR